LFSGKRLHLDNPAQFVRVDLVRVAPGKARYLCRNLFQLIGVGYDDRGLKVRFHPVFEQPGEGKSRDGSLDEDVVSSVSVLKNRASPKSLSSRFQSVCLWDCPPKHTRSGNNR
jgi:hypothetical protein